MKARSIPNLISLFLLFTGYAFNSLNAQSVAEIQNIDFHIEGDNLVITYDIVKAREGETFNVWSKVITDSGTEIFPSSVSGDTGSGIYGGTGKQIVWDLKADGINFQNEISVEVSARSSLKDEEAVSTPEKVDKPFVTPSNACAMGTQDAKMFHGKKGGHVALGILFGPFAVLGAALASPTPQKGARTYYMSQNRELFTDPQYVRCYKKKAKANNVGNTFLGWGIWVGFVLIMSAGQ